MRWVPGATCTVILAHTCPTTSPYLGAIGDRDNVAVTDGERRHDHEIESVEQRLAALELGTDRMEEDHPAHEVQRERGQKASEDEVLQEQGRPQVRGGVYIYQSKGAECDEYVPG